MHYPVPISKSSETVRRKRLRNMPSTIQRLGGFYDKSCAANSAEKYFLSDVQLQVRIRDILCSVRGLVKVVSSIRTERDGVFFELVTLLLSEKCVGGFLLLNLEVALK
ncbi:hypothetical protein TNCT_314131 [Trichonephila clavata]|uniref:Uncharacterized protein n=1 Tax=Trichonephila clavata TaxID=2740835 RepID=A0A8X6HG77_TRICU|nr:hypothetical protein TNCT_314131 [Trichonephila clavata]